MSEESRAPISFRPFRFITGKIRNKLLAAFLLASLGTVVVAVVGFLSIDYAQRTVDEVVEKKGKSLVLIGAVEREVLQARLYDQEYLLNFQKLDLVSVQKQHLDRVEEHVANAVKIIDELVSVGALDDETIESLSTVKGRVVSYQEYFLKVAELLQQRSKLGGEEGEEEEEGGALFQIEAIVDRAGIYELQEAVEEIEEAEKAYLLEGRKRYVYQSRELLAEFEEEVLESNLSYQLKAKIAQLLEEHAEEFNSFTALDLQISHNKKLYEFLVSYITPDISTLIEKIQQEQESAIAEMKERQEAAVQALIVFAATTLLLGLIVSFILAKRLTKQIDNISDLFGSIGIGDFSARADVIAHDELGEMAESLNAMLDNTLTLIQSRDERDAIQNSIMNLLMEISDLAEGDLTARAEVTEEITGALADSFNTMAEQLSRVVVDVKQASALVGSSSQDVDEVTKRLAERSDEQANKIKEAITTIEEMAAKIREVSTSANESAKVSDKALSSAKEGSEAVKKTNEAMASIKENMRGTARTIKRLGESSQEIGNIVQIINDIADRTSILALNASIQASMAGDAGRGFAVVAEEVQRLAERSAESTKQIESLITTIQGDISAAGTSMETSVQYVVEGTDLADEAYEKLDEIESVSNQLAEIIASISASAQEQSIESENITNMMQEVGVLTDETTDATKETTASMEKITSTSKQLEESIAVFKVAA